MTRLSHFLVTWTLIAGSSWYGPAVSETELIHVEGNTGATPAANAAWSYTLTVDQKVSGDSTNAPSWTSPFTPLAPTGTWSHGYSRAAGAYNIPAQTGYKWYVDFNYYDGQERYHDDSTPWNYATRTCTKYIPVTGVEYYTSHSLIPPP